LRKVTLNNSLS